MAANTPFLILIAGGTASGKTTLAHALQAKLGSERCAGFSLDNFYRDQQSVPFSERLKVNYDHPDSLDFDALLSAIKTLKEGQAVNIPIYDFAGHTRDLSRTEGIPARPVIVVEGILALWNPAVRALADLTVFVDAPASVRFERRLERDVRERGRTPDGVRAQWEATVEPMYQAMCAPTAENAAVKIQGTSETEIGLASVLRYLPRSCKFD